MSATVIHGDAAQVLATLPAESVDSIVTDPPAGIAFMGKSWDGDRGGRDAWIMWLTGIMTEAHRVLKPGGHALVWALPRTTHWTATALEDAGFEIRDCVVHLFGTGFPKGLDVGKAIDRAVGNGARWEGWNTSLKPGHEQWWLVRKPLRGTVAANVVEYGTGAINVNGCRVPSAEPIASHHGTDNPRSALGGGWNASYQPGDRGSTQTDGRWPTNIVFTHSVACMEDGPCSDDCPAKELDAQSGVSVSKRTSRGDGIGSGYHGSDKSWDTERGHTDSGGASRFYPVFRYQAKAPARERPKMDGIRHPTIKPLDLMRWLVRLVTPPGGTVLDPFAGSGTTLEAAALEGFSAIGVEADETYVPLIHARLSRVPKPREGNE